MKNIHLIPTDKPSRLQLNVNTKRLILFNNIQSNNESAHLTTQNIYITSDEEITEGDYYLYGDEILKSDKLGTFDVTMVDICKKIILTTDPKLINDSVQGIDDEFLQWFVKNPGCDYVKVKLTKDSEDHSEIKGGYREEWQYFEIIIPKE